MFQIWSLLKSALQGHRDSIHISNVLYWLIHNQLIQPAQLHFKLDLFLKIVIYFIYRLDYKIWVYRASYGGAVHSTTKGHFTCVCVIRLKMSKTLGEYTLMTVLRWLVIMLVVPWLFTSQMIWFMPTHLQRDIPSSRGCALCLVENSKCLNADTLNLKGEHVNFLSDTVSCC